MIIRDFKPEDAEECLHVRYEAIKTIFTGKISTEDVDSHLSAYKPPDLIRKSEEGKSFVADDEGVVAGFCTILKTAPAVADLPFIYIKLDCLKQGIGSGLLDHMEEWISNNWLEVTRIEIETVVPGYNRSFYERLGYQAAGPCEITVGDRNVPALKLIKEIARS
ncbi:GNAT family N-acetyltransferase [Planctomycetota bacterium]